MPKPLSMLLTLGVAACTAAGRPGAPPAPDADAAPALADSETAVSALAVAPDAGRAAFSDVQADRGRDRFRALCTNCHSSSKFSDAQFKFKWSRQAAGDLYETISTSMPETAPGSLTAEEAVDLVSYILRINGFSAGASELAPTRTVLDRISLRSICDN